MHLQFMCGGIGLVAEAKVDHWVWGLKPKLIVLATLPFCV